MTNWIFPPENNIPADLLAWANDPLLAHLLFQRGIDTPDAARQFTNPADYTPAPATDLPDIPTAVSLLCAAIDHQTPICVWGDFDVDGQTSTALLVSVLRDLGAKVDYHVPHRMTEGHGIRLENLNEVLDGGAKLILTCDTGIEAHDAVETVHRADAQIIITDHHDLPEKLPPADAVINPKRLPVEHPLRELPGVGVAFKLAQALATARNKPQLTDALLDLVALGIVADVATQTDDTRYLLQRGLEILNKNDRLGLRALLENTNLPQNRLTSEHIGFWIAPRLNALGRLSDASQGVELLLADDWGRARILAAQLDALNERRRMMVDRTVVQALSLLANNPSLATHNAIVLAASEWHPGVLGLACSRLAAQFNRPAILLTRTADGMLRGSARSVAGCDIHQAIKSQADLLGTFGGHPMAAGLSMPEGNLIDFRRGVSTALADCVAQFSPRVTIDALVSLAEINIELLETIQKLAPFGAGNPPVMLAVRNVRVEKTRIFGRARTHRRVTVADDDGNSVELIWWGGADESVPEGDFDVAFNIARDDYRGGDAIQLVWQSARQETRPAPKARREIIDLRNDPDPRHLFDEAGAIFWASENLATVTRLTRWGEIHPPVKKLVVWQAPPGHDILQSMLAQTQAEKVYFVARPSALDSPDTFLRYLMGVVKFALKNDGGRLTFADVAATMVHSEMAVRLAVNWLITRGKLRTIVRTGDTWVLRADNVPPRADAGDLEDALRDLLAETAAYRDFVRRAGFSALFPDAKLRK